LTDYLQSIWLFPKYESLEKVWVQVCANGGPCVTLQSLPGLDCVTRICMRATPQAVTIANDQVLFAHQPTVAWFVCNFVKDPFVIWWPLMTVAIT